MINSFHHLQAETFIDWRNRLSEESDFASAFEFWLDGKDFLPVDKLAISRLVSELFSTFFLPVEEIITASGVS